MNKPNKLGFLEVKVQEEGFPENSLSQFINANKVFCFSLFLFLCFLISTLVSIAISLLVTPAPAPSTKAVMLLSNSLNEIKSEQTQLIQNYQEFKQEQLLVKQELNSDNVTALKHIIMDQEQNFQLFLQSLKQGMQSLSGDLPNGDKWYQDYSEQINLAEKHSFRRHTLLSMIQTDTYQQD